MRCRQEIHDIKGEQVVVGLSIKADSDAERKTLRKLCLDHPEVIVPTKDDYEFVTIRFKGHEYTGTPEEEE